MTRVRHSNVGREDMNSLISRQHIANPRPLTARQDIDSNDDSCQPHLFTPVTST